MQPYLEIFFTHLAADQVWFVHEQHPLTAEAGPPDQQVRARLARTFPPATTGVAASVIHSTSWRYEAGRLILTYLVYTGALTPATPTARSVPLGELALARSGDPTAPHPPQITPHHVLAHGLRHLRFLAQTDRTVRAALRADPGTLPRLMQLPPALAGNLPTGLPVS
jgi:hypothetical protein